jgi:hypothetical protein
VAPCDIVILSEAKDLHLHFASLAAIAP